MCLQPSNATKLKVEDEERLRGSDYIEHSQLLLNTKSIARDLGGLVHMSILSFARIVFRQIDLTEADREPLIEDSSF